MFAYEKGNSMGRFAVLAGLWFINILILIFGSPFLIFKKAQRLFSKPAKKPLPNTADQKKSTQYFPCRN